MIVQHNYWRDAAWHKAVRRDDFAVAAQSLKLMSAQLPRRYRTVLYWRPLVPGLNDSDDHLDHAG